MTRYTMKSVTICVSVVALCLLAYALRDGGVLWALVLVAIILENLE